MKKYRVRLKNNSWLSFDEETGEIKLPEHFGVDLMYNNGLSKEQIKIAHKRAEENDIRLLQEENEKLNLYIEFYKSIIDKAIAYLESNEHTCNYVDIYNYALREEDLLNILKGDNK